MEILEHGINLLKDLGMNATVLLGEYIKGNILAQSGQIEMARETLEKALTMMEETGMMYWPDRAREVLVRLEE